jgi:hypothetical protein
LSLLLHHAETLVCVLEHSATEQGGAGHEV